MSHSSTSAFAGRLPLFSRVTFLSKMVEENCEPKSISSSRSWQNMVVPVPRLRLLVPQRSRLRPQRCGPGPCGSSYHPSKRSRSAPWTGSAPTHFRGRRPLNLLRAFFTKVRNGAGMQLVFVNTKLLGASYKHGVGPQFIDWGSTANTGPLTVAQRLTAAAVVENRRWPWPPAI